MVGVQYKYFNSLHFDFMIVICHPIVIASNSIKFLHGSKPRSQSLTQSSKPHQSGNLKSTFKDTHNKLVKKLKKL